MKHIIIFIFLSIILNINCFSQSCQVNFYYDGNGNRIMREVTNCKLAEADSLLLIDTAFINQNNTLIRNDSIIRIFPNPTEGKLTIQLLKLKCNNNLVYEIIGLKGEKIEQGTSQNPITELDISPFPPGMYLIRVSIEKYYTLWKIIKY